MSRKLMFCIGFRDHLCSFRVRKETYQQSTYPLAANVAPCLAYDYYIICGNSGVRSWVVARYQCTLRSLDKSPEFFRSYFNNFLYLDEYFEFRTVSKLLRYFFNCRKTVKKTNSHRSVLVQIQTKKFVENGILRSSSFTHERQLKRSLFITTFRIFQQQYCWRLQTPYILKKTAASATATAQAA